MLYTLIWLILLAFIYSSKNREPEINDFAVILVEFSSPRWQTFSKFNDIACSKSLILISHVWACKVFCLHYFVLQGRKSKIFFQIFVRIMPAQESNHHNATSDGLKQK